MSLNISLVKINTLARKRIEICESCEHMRVASTLRTKYKSCKLCGCSIEAKARVSFATCPLAKWEQLEDNKGTEL